MADRKDPRYRGRRRTSAQRRPGHLRTTYADDDLEAFCSDLERLRSVWPQDVLKSDRKAIRMQYVKTIAIIGGIVMLPATVMLVWAAAEAAIQWWNIPLIQTFILFYIVAMVANANRIDVDKYIYREADRRGIKYLKGETPLYHIMNRMNADYNSHLWNRTFKW